jgi:hypothetical protein
MSLRNFCGPYGRGNYWVHSGVLSLRSKLVKQLYKGMQTRLLLTRVLRAYQSPFTSGRHCEPPMSLLAKHTLFAVAIAQLFDPSTPAKTLNR